MITSDQPLPPLPAIRAFEAAARHLSFTLAATELGLTQAAVSYQIKQLEDRVGLPLFARHGRGVSLTGEGARLAARAGEALDLLRQAFAEARRDSREALVISALPTFATRFLAARLGRFQISHPDVMTRVEVDFRAVDLIAGEATVAIRSGGGRWPGLEARLLMQPSYTPVISPAFIARHGRPERPEDLLSLPLCDPDDSGWDEWFALAGLKRGTGGARSRGPGLAGTQLLTAEAALAGNGASLLCPVFFPDLVARGDLILPFDLYMPDPACIYLVYPEKRRNSPAIRAFRDWLLAEMREFLPANGRGGQSG